MERISNLRARDTIKSAVSNGADASLPLQGTPGDPWVWIPHRPPQPVAVAPSHARAYPLCRR